MENNNINERVVKLEEELKMEKRIPDDLTISKIITIGDIGRFECNAKVERIKDDYMSARVRFNPIDAENTSFKYGTYVEVPNNDDKYVAAIKKAITQLIKRVEEIKAVEKANFLLMQELPDVAELVDGDINLLHNNLAFAVTADTLVVTQSGNKVNL